MVHNTSLLDYSHGYNNSLASLADDFARFDLHMAILTIVMTLFGLLFNIVIFYVFWGMRKSPNALIFLNLAAVDVVLACLVMPASVAILMSRAVAGPEDPPSPPHYLLCAGSGCVFEMSVLCTVGFIFLASVDRFLGVFHPHFHRKHFCRDNLNKMIITIWIISPVVIIIFVSSWISASSSPNHIFTNLDLFTVCMGEYWLRHEEHSLHNLPSYLTVVLLSLLMVVIVIANLAVLKQLFRSRPKPLAQAAAAAAVATDGRKKRRNNTATMLAPPILINSESPEALSAKKKDALKRMSLAEQDVKSSDRIFQTDSDGNVTGINISAILKLYVKSTRCHPKIKSRKQSNMTRHSSDPSITVERAEVTETSLVAPTPTLSSSVLTPVTALRRSTVLEECQEEEEEEEDDDIFLEDEEEEELRKISTGPVSGPESPMVCERVYRPSYTSEVSSLDFERSISVSTLDAATITDEGEEDLEDEDEEDDFALDDDSFPESETVWKVVKYVAALKRNSRKRQLWDQLEMARSSSDSDLTMLRDTAELDLAIQAQERTRSPRTRRIMEKKVSRKFSEAVKSGGGATGAGERRGTFLQYTFDRQPISPTMEEIDELVNGGELSPLVRRAKYPDMATLVRVISNIKKKSLDARSDVQRRASRISVMLSPNIRGLRRNRQSNEAEKEAGQSRDGGRSPVNMGWGTLAVLGRMKMKFREQKNRARHEAPPEPEPLSLSSEIVEGLLTLPTFTRAPPTTADQILLNTITEEEDSPTRGATIPLLPSVSSSLTVPLATTMASPRPGSSSTTSESPRRGTTPSDAPPGSAAAGRNSRTFSRTRSLENCQNPSPALMKAPKRRRGGVFINQEELMTPSPCGDGFSRGNSTATGPVTGLKQRMRQSSVYRMGMRNSMNIASITQMVYNFNKHSRKKKKEIRAAKTIIILVFYYIVTLLAFVISFYWVTMLKDSEKSTIPYIFTFYAYIIYCNAVFNPVIHFWRNARVRGTVLRVFCPRSVNEQIKKWKLRGGMW